MNETLKDWRGTPIIPGARIIYPDRRGSTMWMNEALVVVVTEGQDWLGRPQPALRVRKLASTWREDSGGRLTTLTRVDRVTVISAVPVTAEENL